MKAKVWIVTKTNGFGEILELDLYSSHYDAQQVVKSEYETEMKEAEEEGYNITGCECGVDYAWIDMGWDETYHWDIFERDIPQEML